MKRSNRFLLIVLVAMAIPLIFSAAAFGWPSVYPTGTTIHNPEKAFNGYTLIAPLDAGKPTDEFYANPGTAYLLDMNGNVVHQWKLPFPPGLHARLLPNGNLLFAGRSGKVDPPDRPGVGKYPMGGAAGWLI
ncbi:MAG: hypothetical protein HYY65_14580, partial [Candidatus Tectomicrobia bacterium]|nr:hypothetical protein [Candidatus Tectomicrobia bacterium]